MEKGLVPLVLLKLIEVAESALDVPFSVTPHDVDAASPVSTKLTARLGGARDSWANEKVQVSPKNWWVLLMPANSTVSLSEGSKIICARQRAGGELIGWS